MSGLIQLESIVLDLDTGRVVHSDGKSEPLTSRETALLNVLINHGGEVSRDFLLEQVWGYSPHVLSRAVDATVARLRRKLEQDPNKPSHLLTVHGVGYRWSCGAPKAARILEKQEVRYHLLSDRIYDSSRGGVEYGKSEYAELTRAERKIMDVLCQHLNQWVPVEKLSSLREPTQARKALARTIYRLRKKIERDPSQPQIIEGKRGLGYRLNATLPTQTGLSADTEVIWGVAQHIGTILGFDDCVIYLKEEGYLKQVAAWGVKSPREQVIASPILVPIGKGIVGSVAVRGRPEIVADTANDQRYIFDQYAGRSELAVPILSGPDREVIGVIDSENKRVRAYGKEEQATFESLAAILSAVARDLRSNI